MFKLCSVVTKGTQSVPRKCLQHHYTTSSLKCQYRAGLVHQVVYFDHTIYNMLQQKSINCNAGFRPKMKLSVGVSKITYKVKAI